MRRWLVPVSVLLASVGGSAFAASDGVRAATAAPSEHDGPSLEHRRPSGLSPRRWTNPNPGKSARQRFTRPTPGANRGTGTAIRPGRDTSVPDPVGSVRLPGGYAFPDGKEWYDGREWHGRDRDDRWQSGRPWWWKKKPVRYVRFPGSDVVYVVIVDNGCLHGRFTRFGSGWYGWGWDDSPEFPDDYEVEGIYAGVRPILSGAYNEQILGSGEEEEGEERAPVIDFADLSPLGQADILLQAGETRRAIDAYREHLEANAEDTRAMRELAVLLLREGRTEDGLALLHLAYAQNPRLAEEALPGVVLGGDAGALRGLAREAVRYAHARPSAAAWLAVAVLMQAQEKDGRTVGAQINRAEGLGLPPEVADALRRAEGLALPARSAAPEDGEEDRPARGVGAPAAA